MVKRAQLALGPVDIFHVHTHQEMRAQGLGDNRCALVIELDGRLDVARLGRRLTRAVALLPELRWRLRRDASLRYVWRAGSAPARRLGVTALPRGGSLLTAAMELVDRPMDLDRLWHAELLRGSKRDALALCWFHALTDARGGLRWLRWLGTDVDDDTLAAPPPAERYAVGAPLLAPYGLFERLRLARTYFRHVVALADQPIVSLHSAAGGAAPGRLCAVRLCLDEATTARFDARIKQRARLAETSVMQIAAGRLLARLLQARGQSAPLQLVPVPLSLDAGHGEGRMFGNNLTMMMLALEAEQLSDEAEAVASLAEQRREIVRAKLDAGMLAGLQLAARLPARIYNWAAQRPLGGERSSLVLSNPGAFDISSFLGVGVRDAFAAPTTLASPGLQVVADRFAGRLSLVLVFREGLVSQTEMSAQLEPLRADLLGG